jgi:general secretion pathway protein J
MPTHRGFTLLELILALAIMGMVVLVALGAFRIGQRAWERGDAVAAQNQRLRIGAERLRQQLAAATIYLMPGENDTVIGFTGSASEIRFVSRLSLVPGHEQGLVYVHYRLLETADQGQVLAFYEQPVMLLEGVPQDEPEPEAFHRLIVGLGEAAWQYRGGGDTAEGLWQSVWETGEELRLPKAVRLRLRFGNDPLLSVVIRMVNPEEGS